MELSERKKKILQIVVDDYIDTAVPVSSKAITEKYMSSISSATVRSELSALEELGYLTQLHTSSGRVPSPEAYKLYVSELMIKDKLTTKDLNYIKNIFLEKTDNIENVLKNAVKVISELTDYTSVGVHSKGENDKLRQIKFFRFKPETALVLIVTDVKLLKDNYISIPASMSDEQLEEASMLINKLFSGKTFKEICKTEVDFNESFSGYKTIFINVIEALKVYFIQDEQDVLMEGEEKFLKHADYLDVDRIKEFLSVVTKKDKVFNILTEDNKDIKFNVKIGIDGDGTIPKDCSVVSATYSANGNVIGTYGVIGPARMDYQKVVAVLENVGKILESILSGR
ncbi:MAG: heat-inducible transcription repressor HrcA [Clostridia bacterium]|nr:heat-inducible transcription repressor HrcA [Clostridia bacterium]